MAEQIEVIASAVVVPEPLEPSPTPTSALKRRQSSLSEEGSKRLRLNVNNNDHESIQPDAKSPKTLERRSESRKIGQDEERKRGRRLFGNLLGTLSQSTSTTAQKRRTDIEKKQQAKLKLQEAEHDEQKKKQFDELMARRRKEQLTYDKQSMHLRHKNLIHNGNFLQTKTEPKLYYKPWKLKPEEQARIKSQSKGAEMAVAQEVEDFEQQRSGKDVEPDLAQSPTEITLVNAEAKATALHETLDLSVNTSSTSHKHSEQPGEKPPEHGVSRDIAEDHEEPVVDGGDDPVIY